MFVNKRCSALSTNLKTHLHLVPEIVEKEKITALFFFHKTFDPGDIYLIIRTEDPNLGINHSKTFTSNPTIYMKEFLRTFFIQE